MAQIVIIGAGLTGLSTAYYLEQSGYDDYVIYEKEAKIGGFCRSVRQDGFTFDYTGHLLHINNAKFKTFLQETVSLDLLNSITRQSRILSNDVITDYPFQTNLYGLPPAVIADCIEGFIKRKKIREPKTFYSWILTHFGTGFAKHFFLPYQQKLFCTDAKKFTPRWTGRFVPQTDLETIITGALKPAESSVGYNAHFYYPKTGGIDRFINAIAQKIKKQIHTSCEVHKIDLLNKKIIFTNGHVQSYNIIINTMPLNSFLKQIIDTNTTHFQQQHRHLIANSVLNINLGISREKIADYHWLYLPEKKWPFYRLGFSHNFAQPMAPAGSSALYTECSFIGKKDPRLSTEVLKKVKQFFKLGDTEIITEQELLLPHAYVIYNFWRERHLESLLARLAKTGIYSIGRYGAWKYSSMQEAVLDAQRTVEKLLHKKRFKEKRTTLTR